MESESSRSLIMASHGCFCLGTSQIVLSESCNSPNAPDALIHSTTKLTPCPTRAPWSCRVLQDFLHDLAALRTDEVADFRHDSPRRFIPLHDEADQR